MGIVAKVKDALHHDNDKDNSSHNTHQEGVPREQVPRSTHNPSHTPPPTTSTNPTRSGMNTGNEYTHSSTTAKPSKTTEGPHNKDKLNKADPRIDSDRSGGYTGNAGGDYGGSGREGVVGPHGSKMANAADPRVDSDRDASRTVRNNGKTTGVEQPYGTQATTAGGHHGVPTSGAGVHNGVTGVGSHQPIDTHDSTLNRDRTDYEPENPVPHSGLGGAGAATGHQHGASNLSHGQNAGYPSSTGHQQTGLAGSHKTTGLPSSGSHGTTSAPSSDAYASGGRSGTTPTTSRAHHHTSPPADGPAPKTAGPHKSDLLNKADPRVDSDHSKTSGPTGYPTTSTHTSGSTGASGYGDKGVGNHSQGAALGGQGVPASGNGVPDASYGSGHSSTGQHGTTGGYGDRSL